MALRLGSRTSMGGYATKAIFVAGQRPQELEDRIGYHRGRLAQGFLMLVIDDRIVPSEIELVGHSHFSGGRIGHPTLANRVTAEESLRQAFGGGLVARQKQLLAQTLNAGGSDTVVKVQPTIRHDPAMPDHKQYPVGTGIPQFNLLTKKTFVVRAVVGAGKPCPKIPELLAGRAGSP